jgi:hypothetical protein
MRDIISGIIDCGVDATIASALGEDSEILDAIMPLITAAFWSGLTAGHHVITGGRYFVPRGLIPYCGSAGGRGGGSR